MEIDFEKWHGNKNDFILTWFNHDAISFEALRKATPQLCGRDGAGIGADGILVLHTKTAKDLLPYQLSIINSDGSLAETCGNGIRCAALSILQHHHEADCKVDLPEGIDLNLRNGKATIRFLGRLEASRRGQLPLVAVEMGRPVINKANPDFTAAATFLKEKAQEIGLPEITRDWSLVSLGNRHLVINLEKVSRDLIRKIGPALQTSDLWDGINVHIVANKALGDGDRRQSSQSLGQAIDELFEVFVWERGAGETQACGSGACAVAAASFASGFSDRKTWLGIDMPGGRLYIKQESEDDQMTMAGPAALVFRGTFSL